MGVEIRSHFPPSPSSHSLAPSAVEALSCILHLLDSLFKVQIMSPSIDEKSKWNVFNEFSIIDPKNVNLQELPNLYALEKLQYLNGLIACPFKFSSDLLQKISSNCLHWIMNAIQLFTSDILYSSHQLCKFSKTPLYTKTFMAISGFFIRCCKENSFHFCIPWIIEYIFHPHFMCNELATELWCFIIRNTNDITFTLDTLRQMVRNNSSN